MKQSRITSRKGAISLAFPFMTVIALVGASLLGTTNVSANHPVLVEGNCNNPPAGSSLPAGSAVGTCGDYDGDGRIGTAEDTDGPDRVFGTINAALGNGTGAAAGTGANQNGRIIIVTSGTFAEVVTITGANGNVQLEAAPGVEANIDAVLQGDVAGANAGRQNADGIIVNSPHNRYVQIRNITSRNWRSGILVMGSSRVVIESCRLDNNVDYGIEVTDSARVTVAKSEIHGTGFRQAPGVDNTPTPAKASSSMAPPSARSS